MTAHPFNANRILRRPAEPADDMLDAPLILALERVADGRPVRSNASRRLSARRLAIGGRLSAKGQSTLALIYTRRSRVALLTLEGLT